MSLQPATTRPALATGDFTHNPPRVITRLLRAMTTKIPESFLRDLSETRRFAAGRPVNVKVVAGESGPRAVFLRAGPRSNRQTLFAVNVPGDGQAAGPDAIEILNPELLVGSSSDGELSVAEKAMLERMRVAARGFITYQLDHAGKRVLVAFSGRLYLFELASKKVQPLGPEESLGACVDPKFSPDDRHVWFVRNNDLWRVDIEGNVEEQITFGGTEEVSHGLADFCAQEEMHRFTGYWIAPDSKSVCFQETDNRQVEMFHISDPIAPEKAPIIFPYPRPGRKNPVVKLGIIDLDSEKDASGQRNITWIQRDLDAFPYVATVVWPRIPSDSSVKTSPLCILVQNREQTYQELVVCTDLATGSTRKLLSVTDDKWINLDQGFPHFFLDGDSWKFFWGIEEEEGWRVAVYELGNAGEAVAIETWVEPTAGYTKMIGFDDASMTLYFRGGPNPTESYIYRAKKESDGRISTTRVTNVEGKGVEDAALVGSKETGKFLSLVRTDLATMPTTWLYRCPADAAPGPVMEVPSIAESPGFKPNVSIAQLPGPKDFWTAIVRPYSAKPGVKLPIILQVYGGPHHLEVTNQCLPNLVLQWLADKTGAIVVKLDGRGTPGRGRKWEREIKGDFLTAPIADQCDGVRAIAKTFLKDECVDVEKEGIKGVNGWSYGGYMAAAMAFLSQEIGGLKVSNAVAGAPVTDWLLYDTHYTERYAGVPDLENSEHPVTKAYEKCSLLERCGNLGSRLLLIHG